MWQVVADLGQIMINAKKSNSVKNTTNNMYKQQIIFVEIDLWLTPATLQIHSYSHTSKDWKANWKRIKLNNI